jgi:hypothetical protein
MRRDSNGSTLSVRTASVAGGALGLVAVALVAVLTVGQFVGCEASSHSFVARRFDPLTGCLATGETLDVLPGPETPDTCAAVCLQSGSDQPGATYVTTACEPYPHYLLVTPADAGEVDPTCARALAALESETGCEKAGETPPEEDGGEADTDGSAGNEDGSSEADGGTAEDSGLDATD